MSQVNQSWIRVSGGSINPSPSRLNDIDPEIRNTLSYFDMVRYGGQYPGMNGKLFIVDAITVCRNAVVGRFAHQTDIDNDSFRGTIELPISCLRRA